MSVFKILCCGQQQTAPLKDAVVAHLRQKGYMVDDLSAREDGKDWRTYQIGELTGKLVGEEKKYDFAIIFCGSGMGVCLSANRFQGVYCAHCESIYTVKMARGINNANVLAMGVNVIPPKLGCYMAEAFVSTKFLQDAPEGSNLSSMEQSYRELQEQDYAAHHLQTNINTIS